MATVPYTFANAPGGSSIPLEELDANFAALQGQLGPTGPTGAKGTDGTSSSIYYYKANTVSTSGDPGLGYLSWNSTTQIGANLLNVSHQTSNIVDIDIFLSLLDVGQEVIVQDVTSSANYQRWVISGSVININPNTVGSYFIIPVSLSESGGVGTTNFPGNAQLFLAVASNPPGPTGPTGPSVTGPTGATGSTGPSGVATPAGSTGQVQFNSSSVLGADSNFVWDNTNKRLGIGAASPQYPLEVNSSGSNSTFLGKNIGSGAGVSGQAVSGSGVIGLSTSGDGVVGQSSTGYAGTFYGKLRVPNAYTNSITGKNVAISSSGEFGVSLIGASDISSSLYALPNSTVVDLRTFMDQIYGVGGWTYRNPDPAGGIMTGSDAGPAITAAGRYLRTNYGHGTIYIPPTGIFAIKTAPSPNALSGNNIVGAGRAASLLCYQNASGACLSFTGYDFVQPSGNPAAGGGIGWAGGSVVGLSILLEADLAGTSLGGTNVGTGAYGISLQAASGYEQYQPSRMILQDINITAYSAPGHTVSYWNTGLNIYADYGGVGIAGGNREPSIRDISVFNCWNNGIYCYNVVQPIFNNVGIYSSYGAGQDLTITGNTSDPYKYSYLVNMTAMNISRNINISATNGFTLEGNASVFNPDPSTISKWYIFLRLGTAYSGSVITGANGWVYFIV